ncbi:hypothetical protein HY388_00150 [Candidatus Daviesbacteria bacterium]|nr:hypothetical protein [Candidatus Daviesbacteria bacterium]
MQKFIVPERDLLPRPEAQLLAALEQAAEAGAQIFARQQDTRFAGANFYPHGATKDQIAAAAQTNPLIYDPYHVVVAGNQGELATVPYHEYYREQIKPILAALNKAVGFAARYDQKMHLAAIGAALQKGNHEGAVEAWLSMDPEPKVCAVIGFYDRYTDGLFNRKYAFEAWVGILDEDTTQTCQSRVDEIIDVWRKRGLKPADMAVPKIRVRVDRTTIFSGQAALYDWGANNLPCQRQWRERYGSKFVIFESNFVDKMVFGRIPLLGQTVDKDFTDADIEQIFEAALLNYLGHEPSHAFIRRPQDEERLGGEYAMFSELYCTALGMWLALDLDIDDQLKDSVLAMHFAATADDKISFETKGTRREYAEADLVIFNFLREKKLITIHDGRISWKNWRELQQALGELVHILEQIASAGDQDDVLKLQDQYGSKTILDRLSVFKSSHKGPKTSKPLNPLLVS